MKGMLEQILNHNKKNGQNGQNTPAEKQEASKTQKPVLPPTPDKIDGDQIGAEDRTEESAQIELINQELNRRTIYCTHLNNIQERFGKDFTSVETKVMYRAIFDLSNRDFEYIEQIRIKENPVTGNILMSLLERFEEQFNRIEYDVMLKTIEYYFPAYIARIREAEEQERTQMEEAARISQEKTDLEKKQAAAAAVPRG